MADRYHHPVSPSQRPDVARDTWMPQLPNFDHFVRGAGQPDLAHPAFVRQEPAPDTLAKIGHPSQPAPPSSTSFWERSLQQLQQPPPPPPPPPPLWTLEHTANRPDRPTFSFESQRRASCALPTPARPQPRPVRAYSNTITGRPYCDFTGLRQGPITHEEHTDRRSGSNNVIVGEASSIWGVTKAGKPRKRLSQACSACREKKIKCDPGFGTKCSQCSRFNRECRFGTNPRQGHRGPKFRTSTSSSDAKSMPSPKERLPSRRSSITLSELSDPTDVIQPTSSRKSSSSNAIVSPTMSDWQPNDAPTPSKRQRVSADISDRADDSILSRRSVNVQNHQFGYATGMDPIVANEKLTKHYLQVFMDCVNIPTFEIFPRQRMLEWASLDNGKTLEDRLVVYAMMAMATLHSTDPNRIAHRALFKSIIYQHLEQLETNYTLKVAHILFFTSFTEFADLQYQKGFGLFVRTVGCAAFLRLNIDHECSAGEAVYGFSPSMSAECRRRTYWTVFVTDTFAALSNGDPRLMYGTDIFLKLPCATELYDQDRIPELPIFDQENVLSGIPTTQTLVQMADLVHLIQVAMICSEIQLNAWRARNAHRIGRQYSQDRSTRRRLEKRLQVWADTYNAAQRAKSSASGRTDTHPGGRDPSMRAKRYAGLDILFHYAHMELNRSVYHTPLEEEEKLVYAKNANVHALETLSLTQQLLKQGGSETKDYYFATRGPLGGYAVQTALEIITAAGSIADILAPQSSIMTLMWGGCEFLEHLSTWWASAHIQHLQAKERIQTVFNLCQAALYEQKTHFVCSEPMSAGLDKEFDLIYGMDRAQYLRGAYGLSIVKESEIFHIDTRKKEQKLVVS